MGVPSVLLFALLFVVKPSGFRFGAPLCGVMVPVADLWPPERSAVATAQILVSGLVEAPFQPRAGQLTFLATATHVLAFRPLLDREHGHNKDGRLNEPAIVGTDCFTAALSDVRLSSRAVLPFQARRWPEPKLKPRWDVHLSGDDDQLG